MEKENPYFCKLNNKFHILKQIPDEADFHSSLPDTPYAGSMG
jgi:hypothetical protein